MLDLLIVTDNEDILKKWVDKVKKELEIIKPKPSIKVTSIFDPDNERSNIKCNNVAIFTSEKKQSLRLRVVDCLKDLGKHGLDESYIVVNLNENRGEDGANNANTVDGLKEDNIIQVHDMQDFSVWWPRLIRLHYGKPLPMSSSCFIKNLSESNQDCKNRLDVMTAALQAGEVKLETDIHAADCVVIITESGGTVIEEEIRDVIRSRKSSCKPVHAILLKDEEDISNDMAWITNWVHGRSRPLRPVLWIWNDLELVMCKLPERIKQPLPPPPSPPYEYGTLSLDLVTLSWFEDRDGSPPIRYFTIEMRKAIGCCRVSDWQLAAIKKSDGYIQIHSMVLHSLDRQTVYQFRISSENIHGRSIAVETATLTPGIITKVYDNCPASCQYGMCSDMLRSMLCGCFC